MKNLKDAKGAQDFQGHSHAIPTATKKSVMKNLLYFSMACMQLFQQLMHLSLTNMPSFADEICVRTRAQEDMLFRYVEATAVWRAPC